MKGKIMMMLMIAAAVSCGLEEVGREPHRYGGNVWIRPGVNVDSVAAGEEVVYVTAMEYPDWYDWRTDAGKGSVKCSLTVYAGGVPMMRVPVGDKYEISSDPETHRMVDGHLYTDFRTETETVIKRDGRDLIRYSGSENISDVAEVGGDVYTLGHDASGDGFSFRKNGEILVGLASGGTFGRFHHKDDSISFAFRETLSAEDAVYERYYQFLDGEISQTAVREDIKKVWDIAPFGDGVCWLASVVGIDLPVFFAEGEMMVLTLPKDAEILTGRIFYDDEVIYVEGLMEREGMKITSVIWRIGGNIHIFPEGRTISSICMEGDCISCVLNPSPPFMNGIIRRCGESFEMPDDYCSFGSRTCAMAGGILHVGLSSIYGDRPLIWEDGEMKPLKINGFISSVSTNGGL